MKFLDTNVIIKAFIDNPQKENCRILLSSQYTTNSICLIEAFHAISRISNDKLFAAECIQSVLRSDCIIESLDETILFEALKRVEKYNLNIFDLIHYVTALLNNCSEFISYDKDFDNLEIKRVEP